MKLKFVSLFIALSCSGPPKEPFTLIAKRGITRKRLEMAIDKLPLPAKEPPVFWRKIANDSSYPLFQRRKAVFQLFKRHVHVGMTLIELSRLLNHPKWLRYNDINKVMVLGGEIPISNLSGNVFSIAILPVKEQMFAAVYLRFPDLVFQTSFRRILRGEADTQIPIIGRTKIAEIGFWEDRQDGHYGQ